MTTMRDFKSNPKYFGDKRVIIGHTPIVLSEIENSVQKNATVINIDNGCVFAERFPGKGHLVCIDLDTYKVYYQKNIE